MAEARRRVRELNLILHTPATGDSTVTIVNDSGDDMTTAVGVLLGDVLPVPDSVQTALDAKQATLVTGTAAPTTGAHTRGERVWNSTPSAAGYVGWVCVTAGTPGTWKGFGTIES